MAGGSPLLARRACVRIVSLLRSLPQLPRASQLAVVLRGDRPRPGTRLHRPRFRFPSDQARDRTALLRRVRPSFHVATRCTEIVRCESTRPCTHRDSSARSTKRVGTASQAQRIQSAAGEDHIPRRPAQGHLRVSPSEQRAVTSRARRFWAREGHKDTAETIRIDSLLAERYAP